MEEMHNVNSEDTTAEIETATVSACADSKSKNSIVGFIKKRKLLLIIIAAVVVLGTAAGIVLSSLTPENIAEECAEAYFLSDYAKVEKYTAYNFRTFKLGGKDEEEFFEIQGGLYKEYIETWDDYFSVLKENRAEYIYDGYGEYELTVEATRSKEMSQRKFEVEYSRTLQALEEDNLLDRDDITDVKVVTVKIKIKGEDETDRKTIDIIMVKIGLLWKALDYDIVS